MTPGYQALHEGAAWLGLGGRGKIIARGEDRARLLHAMVTNHVEQLRPGSGCYAFFLNHQGHILADVNLFCLTDRFLLDTEPETVRTLVEHLDRHIIADDVALEDITSTTATVAVEGPKSAGVLNALGAPAPETPSAIAEWGARLVARVDSTGTGGFFVFLPTEQREDLIRDLESAGAVSAAFEDAHAVRLERGRPRYGEDITPDCLPQETQVLRALHFDKGCYLGQEIVERIRSRGHVNRLLVRLALDTTEPPPGGARILAGEKDIGAVTSSAFSPAEGRSLAFGYVRGGHERAGSRFLIGGSQAVVLPPAP
jgi:folate-binding protein YgfZ